MAKAHGRRVWVCIGQGFCTVAAGSGKDVGWYENGKCILAMSMAEWNAQEYSASLNHPHNVFRVPDEIRNHGIGSLGALVPINIYTHSFTQHLYPPYICYPPSIHSTLIHASMSACRSLSSYPLIKASLCYLFFYTYSIYIIKSSSHPSINYQPIYP